MNCLLLNTGWAELGFIEGDVGYGGWFFNYSVLLVIIPLNSKELVILDAQVHGFPV